MSGGHVPHQQRRTDEQHDLVAILDAFCEPLELERRALNDPLTYERIDSAMRVLRGEPRLMVARRVRALGAIDPGVLELLAAVDDARVRLIVARYFLTPRRLLNRLLNDPAAEVRAGLVWNFDYRAVARRRLADDPSDEVREAIAATASTGSATRERQVWKRRRARLIARGDAQESSPTKRSSASSRARAAS
jgi:hypothetical protein